MTNQELLNQMNKLDSLLTIANIEGLSSECYVIDNPEFVDEDTTTILEICYNTGDSEEIEIKR